MNEILSSRGFCPLYSDQRLTSSRLHRIHLLLQEWELIPPSPPTPTSTRTHSNPQEQSGNPTTQLDSRSTYEQRPLPSLPDSSKPGSSRREKERSKTSSQKQSAQPETSGRRRRSEKALGSAHSHEGSSPLEDYVMDPQAHEMIAIGLVKPRKTDRSHL
jgi:hypothetical protein